MGFIMDGLEAEDYDRTYGDRTLVRRVATYFRSKWRVIALVAAMVVLASIADAVMPLILSRALDSVARNIQVRSVILLSLAVLASGGLSWIFGFVRQSVSARVIGDVVLRLRLDAFDAVLRRDMSFFDENPSGRIVSRVTSDTEDFATVVTLVLNLLSQIFLVLIIAVALLIINWRLALIAMAICPLVFVVALGFRRIARQSVRQSQRARGTVNALVQESITGIAIAKNFRQEQAVYNEFEKVNQQAYRVSLRMGLIFTSIFPILSTIASLGSAMIIWFGGLSVLGHQVTAGQWYLFALSVGYFWFPLTSIASFWSQFQQGLSASERVFALIDAEPRVVQTASESVPRLAGKIEFQHVDFAYTPEEPVLRDFSLTIQPGETIALVGHTGAGKSTLGKLVARFYEFQGGKILVDGRDIRSFDLQQYRRQLGVVPQAPFLFAGTLAENIRYGRPAATEDDLVRVAHQVGGGDWLDALPESMSTDVGEEGRSLSLGQRQLVALGRVLLQDPAILVLDEATASVDPLTEAQIQEGLDLVLAKRTAIVIAHRLSTIRNADRIIVLRQGQIVEEGSHEELLRQSGHYAELYNTYFRHQSADYVPGSGFVTVKAS